MLKKIKKRFDIFMISIDIIMLIFMALSITLNQDLLYAWYWITVTIMLFFQVYYISKWDKIDGIDIDKYKSKAIKYAYDGITVASVIISGFLYLTVMGLELLDKSIKNNVFVILIVGIMLSIALLCNFLAVYTANQDTKELIEKTFNNKK